LLPAKSRISLTAPWLLAACLAFSSHSFAAEPVDYLHDIKPILKARCFACHGALKQKAGLRLDTGAAARQGSKRGRVLDPARPSAGELLRRISSIDPAERMPPIGKPLEKEQVGKIRQWIEQGAASPADEKPEPDPREHWAFRLPRKVPLVAHPGLQDSANPIDLLIAAEQERLGVTPAGTAEPEVLLRRVYLDLIGLPPSREELAAFVADPSPSNYERTVERLLASPQYGERWARHWMDIWRYSDWYGRRYVDDVRNSFLNIWHWRDWIIRSLNENHGYDRMIMEMLAGDEIAPGDDDVTAATGFIVRNWYRFNYDQWSRDMVEHTSKAFLGLRTNCALCHDHKYDPISQREYFSLKAFFAPLEIRYDRVPGGPPLAKLLRYKPDVNEAQIPLLPGRPGIYEAYPDQPTRMYRGGDERDVIAEEPPVTPGVLSILGGKLPPIEPVELPLAAWNPSSQEWVQREELSRCAANIRKAVEARGVAPDEAIASPEEQDLVLLIAALKVELAHAEQAWSQARIAAENAKLADKPNATELAKRAFHAERAAALLAARHDLNSSELALIRARAKAVSALVATQNALRTAEKNVAAAEKKVAAAEVAAKQDSTDYTPLGPIYPSRSSGRRRALAAWIANRDNPLTARVAVNHVWGWHFGRPLVATTNDFGRAGAEPVMPAVLDWLAVEFMESGWDFKHLHRLIVTSKAYQRSSDLPPQLAKSLERDKANKTLWHFERQRMDAEVLRDSMLSVAGLLDPTIGGPEIDNALAPTTPRRTIYFTRHPEDGGTMLFTAQFDAPDVCECYRRSESLVPQQALAMINSEITQSVSRALAARLWKEARPSSDDTTRRGRFISLAYEQLLSRSPRSAEQELCQHFLVQQLQIYAPPAASSSQCDEAELRAAESLIRSLLSHNDFITIH
jgi:hypothetical protein